MKLFDCVATHIANTFDLLIGQLIARRDALLTALQVMKEDYTNPQRFHHRAGGANTKSSIKVNTNFQIQQDAIDLYRRNIKQNRFRLNTRVPSLISTSSVDSIYVYPLGAKPSFFAP